MSKICRVAGCDRKIRARGLCSMHYQRFMHHGSTEPLEVHDGLRTKYPDEYRSWYSMISRCTDPKDSAYKNYGGNNVTVCERWLGPYGFRNFLEDMGEKPKHGKTEGGMPIYTIDRIDATKSYCPENCRWANWYKQAAHRSNTSKHPGVYFHKQSGTWCMHCMEHRKCKSKYFKTFEEAWEARKKWEQENPLF